MKFIGHRFVFAAAAAFFAFAGKGDDAVGIVRVDAGTNGVVEAEMPFDAVDGNGPSDFISGFFMGDGSIFSDRLYRFPADSGNEPTPDFGLQSSNAVQSSFAFWSGEHWLDSVTLSNSTMTASAGDTLYLLRTDSDPFSFYLHGRLPSLSSVPSSQFPVFTHISVDPAETNAVVAMETDRAADLFFAQSETNAPIPSVWSYLGRHPGSLSFLFPLASPLTANDYPLTAFFISDATRDTDGDGLSDALEELVHGTNPLLADTDGDGIGDALEIAWGRDPLVSGPAPLTLFSESFEAPEVQPGALDGQHGWNAPTGAVVQTERVHSGAAALMIESEPYESVAATHSITSSLPRSETWLDCRVSAGSCDSIGFPPDDDGSFVAFSFDRFGHPVVLDGSAVVTNTSFQIPVDDTFRRVTLRLDFAASRWDIYVGGVLAGENLAMRGENPSLNEMVVSGNSGFIDDIAVTTARPEGLSSDGDRMADEWELFHFGDLSRDGTLDFDSDGLSDADEYHYGADPKTGDTDSDGIPDLWEAANGLSPADPADAALDPDGDGLANTEEYFYDSDPFTAENATFFLKEGFRDGVNASFYRSGGSITSLPDFSTLQFVESRIVTNINQQATRSPWNDAPPSLIDNFAADYTGYIYVPTNGTVRFKLTSNDGSRLAIDGETVIDYNGTHSMQSKTGSVFLLAGLHPFRVEYFEATTEAGLILSWRLPGGTEEPIPAEFFYIPKRPGSENTDLDNDGVPDWWEKVNGYDTSDPSDAASDPDGDGLTNAEEAALGSNPFSPDTDGDGLADAEEAAFGSSPLKADTDGDGLADAIEHRYGWNPNWPGETNEANAIGPFTTFTHYADGTPAAPQMRMMRSLRSGLGGIAQFHVDVDFQEPYPTNATVYGLASPGGTAYVDDMITRDPDKDFTSISTSNIIYVTTLDPKPAFCTNVAGVFIIKMKCDDHATVSVGGISVQNSWPNQEYAKAWGIIEANTTNVVDITWDSSRGGKWNLDYECYFYPAKFRPPCPEDDDCECGCDRAFNAYNGSVSIRQPFGETPNVPSLPRGSLRIREVEPSSRLASPKCLYYDHPMERRVRVSKGASSTISIPNGEEIVYKNGRPHGYSAGLDSSLSVDAAGRLVERLPDGLLVVYGANGVPVALKPEHCREIAVAELGISVVRDSQGAISSIESASDGTMSVARTSSSSFNVTWTDATNGYVKTFMFSQPSSNIFELNEFVNPSMNTTYRWEYSEEERGWTFVNDYGKADARTESRTAVWNDEARTWTKTQVWYDSDGTPGETETKVYTANGHYPKLSRIERGGETVYQAVPGATGRAGTTTNETGLATENVHDRYGRRVKSSQIVKGGLVETETTSYKPVSSGGFVDFRPVRTIRTLDGIEIERTAWLYETNRKTTTRTVNGVTRTSFAEYDGLGREVLYVSEDGRATRRTYSTDLPVGACTETSETGVFSNGAFSLVDGKSERTVSERNMLGDEVRTERFALVGGEWHSLSFETKTYNAKHQVVSTQYSNGKSSSAAWICTGPLWQVGTDGIAITNIYDGTKSLVSSTRYSPLGAVTTEYVRDCRGRAVQETESAPGVETRTTSRTYDARGRLASMTDEQGRTTTYAYSADNRTTTETLPSGATRITTVNPDGSIASVTGTAQAAEFYSYGVTEDGLEWTQVNYLSPDGAKWHRRYVNGFGETVSEEWPGFGELAQRRRDAEYDSKGRLVRVEETSKPIETRAYDYFGEVTNITYAVDDEWRRIATDTSNALIDGEIWRVSSRIVSCSDPSIAPLTTTNMTQVSGLSLTNESRSVSIDIRGNASESWSEFNPAMAKRISYSRIPTATNIAFTETIDGAAVRSVSHSAVTNTATYDAYRREMVRTDGRGNATTNAYDTLGRLASVTDPLGATTSYAYDAVGNLIAITNALGNATIYEYDLRGNKTYEGGATYPVRYTYDDFDNKTTMTTYRDESLQSGDTTTWLYDIGSGAMTNKVYADSLTIAYTHASDGLLLRETKPSGAWKENVYDAARQIVGVVSSDGAQDASMQRDEFGRVMAESNSVALAEYSLDDCWGATNETQTVDGVSVSFERGFDAYGRIERFTRVGGEESVFGYAPHGAISVVSNGNVAVEYAFANDALDAGYALTVQGGAAFSREVFRDGYLRSCIAVVSNHCGNAAQGLEYSYDALQRLVSRNADSFGYNVRGEVVFSRRDAENAEEAYSYDDIGNLVFNTFGAITNIYFSNSRNQYTSNLCASASLREINYDLDGNMTRHGEWTYAYDSGNRLVSVASNGITVVTMSYDAQGRRVKKVAVDGTHRYFYDGKLLVYEHITRPDNTISEIEYVWGNDISGTRDGAAGIGGLLYQKRDGAIYVPWYDAYGNILSYRDARGNLVASYAYDVFGNIISQSDGMADVLAFRYSTKYFDSETGFYYYGYRFYSPELMRWITRDPIGEDGGYNLYEFCMNSPLYIVDPLGDIAVIDIPGIMDAKKWDVGAALMRHWFSLDSKTPTTPNETIVTMNWVLSFERAKKVYDKIFSEKQYVNKAAQKEIVAMIKRTLKGTEGSFCPLNRPASQVESDYVNTRPVGSLFDPRDDMYAALGKFNLRMAVSGYVKGKCAFVTSVGVYVRDSYDFVGNQSLGYWNSRTKYAGGNFLKGDKVTNESFREHASKTGRGADFLVYSDIKITTLQTAEKVVLSP